MSDVVKITAEPVPYGRNECQLFVNAIVTNANREKLYIPHLLVNTGLDQYYETSDTEGLYGTFPVAFTAHVVGGMYWSHGEFEQNRVLVEYVGEDFWDVEPLDADDDTAYFREWTTWIMTDRIDYYPALEA